MKKISILIAILTLLAFSFGSLVYQSGYDLFQKALAKERAEGNLDEAIALYQKVIQESKDESLAAKAQLRIGICYEKLGQEKATLAQQAFQKVVDKYPGQTETAEAAREKLRILSVPQLGIVKGEAGLNIRSVSPTMAQYLPQVSPDGRSMAFCDYRAAAMAVYNMATGKSRVLKSRLEKDEPDGLSFSYRWSPDGRSIVCSWLGMLEYNWIDLRILSVDGADPRRLLRGGTGEVRVFDWSADGNRILAARYTPSQTDVSASCQIITVAVSDGSIEIVKDLGQKELGQMVFSPDGRFVAYDVPTNPTNTRDIFVLIADGGHETQLVDYPTNERVLGWTPDGRHILFTSDRAGTWGAWLAPVQDGKARGEAVPIKQDIGTITPIGLTRDGTFYYSTRSLSNDVYVQKVDLDEGKMMGSAELAVQKFVGTNHCPDWSADGNYLAYVSTRTIATPSARPHVLCILNVKTGQVRELYPELEWFRYMRWSPDGRSLIARGSDGSQDGAFLIDTATGAVSPAITEWVMPTVEWSLDGRSVYYINIDDATGNSSIVRRSLETSQEKTIATMTGEGGFFQDLSLSPDGRWIAVRIMRVEPKLATFAVVSSAGGEIRVLKKIPEQPSSLVGTLTWSHDSRKILYVKHIAQDGTAQGRYELRFLSADDGKDQKLGDLAHYVGWLSLHPDGHRLAFHFYTPKVELWAMENFLPEAEKK